MTEKAMRLTGKFFETIGIMILIPAGAVVISSTNTLLLAGPLVLLIPLAGLIFAGVGKWMTRRARLMRKI